MNKYMVKIENHKKNIWDLIEVYALCKEDAIQTAKNNFYFYQNPSVSISQDLNYYNYLAKTKYEGYKASHVFSVEINCNPSYPHDKININTIKQETSMAFFHVDWNDYTKILSSFAEAETWSNSTYPDNGILANYMAHTFNKLKSEKKIL